MTSSFVFPDYYNLPPFFTIQPVQETRTEQLKMWKEFIFSYIKYFKKTRLSIEEERKSSLFSNISIDRKLTFDGVHTILEYLIKEGYGEWQDSNHTIILITWKKHGEWVELLHQWAINNGKINNILTIFEIRTGIDSQDEEFYMLDSHIIYKALEILQQRGQVALLDGETEDEIGVKFL